MVACRHSFALRERRQPKMQPEILDDSSLLRSAAQDVVRDRICGCGIRRPQWLRWHGWFERRVRFQSAAARTA